MYRSSDTPVPVPICFASVTAGGEHGSAGGHFGAEGHTTGGGHWGSGQLSVPFVATSSSDRSAKSADWSAIMAAMKAEGRQTEMDTRIVVVTRAAVSKDTQALVCAHCLD